MVVIRKLCQRDAVAARAVILAGLREQWRQLDDSKTPDLADLSTSYDGATFLVAERDGRIVGTGALVPHADGEGEIVRMSVASAHRRTGIGSEILLALLADAKERGLRRVVLETTSSWADARAFYQALGFTFTHYHDEDAYFVLHLQQDASADA